jgi:hypothetical protein
MASPKTRAVTEDLPVGAEELAPHLWRRVTFDFRRLFEPAKRPSSGSTARRAVGTPQRDARASAGQAGALSRRHVPENLAPDAASPSAMLSWITDSVVVI